MWQDGEIYDVNYNAEIIVADEQIKDLFGPNAEKYVNHR